MHSQCYTVSACLNVQRKKTLSPKVISSNPDLHLKNITDYCYHHQI